MPTITDAANQVKAAADALTALVPQLQADIALTDAQPVIDALQPIVQATAALQGLVTKPAG